MATEDCIPFYEPGKRVTAKASATLTSKRFVGISGTRDSGPLLNNSSVGGNLAVGVATAAAWAFGVAGFDTASGQLVTVLRGSGFIVPVVAQGALTAGAAVEVGSLGRATVHASGVIVGYAVATAADGDDAQIALI